MKIEPVPLAGVIGQPASHSRSPRLHGHWLARYGLRGHYIPMDIQSGDLARALDVLPRIGFKGVNVTIPHKEAVLDLADIISDRAALIGAANTLTFQSDGKIYADNTDGLGFISNLNQHVPEWSASDGPALVLGAGGAARAVVAALLQEGVPKIILANRTRARADALKAHFGGKVSVIDWTHAPNVLDEIKILVNSTALGMSGKEELKLSLENITPGTVVNDLVYTPLKTELLARGDAAGCQVVDGLGMLLHQASPGFERWFGYRPEVDEALRRAVLM